MPAVFLDHSLPYFINILQDEGTVIVCVAQVVWPLKDDSQELILSTRWVPGIDHRSTNLGIQCRNMLHHLSGLFVCIWDRVSYWWSSSVWPGCLDNELWVSVFTLSTDDTDIHHCPNLFMWLLGSHTQVPSYPTGTLPSSHLHSPKIIIIFLWLLSWPFIFVFKVNFLFFFFF